MGGVLGQPPEGRVAVCHFKDALATRLRSCDPETRIRLIYVGNPTLESDQSLIM